MEEKKRTYDIFLAVIMEAIFNVRKCSRMPDVSHFLKNNKITGIYFYKMFLHQNNIIISHSAGPKRATNGTSYER